MTVRRHVVTEAQLREAGFEWPLEGALARCAVRCEGGIDLEATHAALESSRAYYRKQVTDAYAFKAQWGARDESDFTDAHEDNVRDERLLSEALSFLERVRAALPPPVSSPDPIAKLAASPVPLTPLEARFLRERALELERHCRLPERSAIASMLETYFVGPISDDVVDRLHSELVALFADEPRLRRESRAFYMKGWDHDGHAWREHLVYRRTWPRPIEVAAWLAATHEGYPKSRLRCPDVVAGVWEDDASPPRRWELRPDGAFVSGDPKLSAYARWGIHHKRARTRDVAAKDDIVLWADDGREERFELGPDDPQPTALTLCKPPEVKGAFPSVVFVLRRQSLRAEDAAFEPIPGGRARTIGEMELAVRLMRRVCERCGSRESGSSRFYEHESRWGLVVPCARCGTSCSHLFPKKTESPFLVELAHDELGPGASELLPAEAFRAELARLAPRIRADPKCLLPHEWWSARGAVLEARTLANELAKLAVDLDDGEHEGELVYELMKLEQRESEEAVRTRAELQRLRTLAASYADEGVRVAAVEYAGSAARVGEVTKETMSAHEAWVARGGEGAGRLVAQRTHARDSAAFRADLRGARLLEVDLGTYEFSGATVDGAQLIDVTIEWRQARPGLRSLRFTLIVGATFIGCSLGDLEGAVVIAANMSVIRSAGSWRDATLEGVRLAEASLEGACLDGVRFIGCDLRDARFGTPVLGVPHGTMRGTIFEDCDLRGSSWDTRAISRVRFVRCILEGARGRPGSLEGVEVDDCDVDRDGLLALLR